MTSTLLVVFPIPEQTVEFAEMTEQTVEENAEMTEQRSVVGLVDQRVVS